MASMRKAAKVTCEVFKSIAPQVEAILVAMRVDFAQVHARRMVLLGERLPLPFLPPSTRLEQDPAEVYEIYLPMEHARSALLTIARQLGLFTAGRGAVYAEEVELLAAPNVDLFNATLSGLNAGEQPGERLSEFSLVSCVVQRGCGNDVARCALEMGANVPTINFGVGTGIRDRLGLLRIAIPADKEIVSLLVDTQDRGVTLEALVDAGRLDQPSRGFIGAYPTLFGIANPRSFRGRQRHGATMEQVIAAIDELKSGTNWRRKSGEGRSPRTSTRWLERLINVIVNCNEASADRIAAAAMSAGAGGATISRTKLFSPTGREVAASPAREVVDLAISPQKLDALIQALRETGAFDREFSGFVETKPLPTAFTYVASPSLAP
jgi:hypothetical protein